MEIIDKNVYFAKGGNSYLGTHFSFWLHIFILVPGTWVYNFAITVMIRVPVPSGLPLSSGPSHSKKGGPGPLRLRMSRILFSVNIHDTSAWCNRLA